MLVPSWGKRFSNLEEAFHQRRSKKCLKPSIWWMLSRSLKTMMKKTLKIASEMTRECSFHYGVILTLS
jgi:hypothetical protein